MLALLCSSLAFAYDSEPQAVSLLDRAELFTNAELSTGFLPADSPLQVEFRIDALGGADVEMEGEGNMSWPDALALSFAGEPGSGMYILDASLNAVTTVRVDIDVYSGDFEIDRRSFTMNGATFFDPFAFADRVEVVDTTDSTQLIYYSYEIFAGVSLDFTADMTPLVTAGFEGVEWTVNEATITQEGESVQLAPARVADYDVEGIFRALWDARLDIVFTPTIEVCAPFVGCVEIASFDIPFEIVADSFEQDMRPALYSFPMPLLVPSVESADFGDVEVGLLANVQIPMRNEGSLAVYGSAVIDGAGEFSVYPNQFNALPGTEDGLVVTFSPTVAGAQTADLVLVSNDPTYPNLVLLLTGNATATPVDEGQDVDESAKGSMSTCGCNGSGFAPSAGALLALGLLLRRRAPRAGPHRAPRGGRA